MTGSYIQIPLSLVNERASFCPEQILRICAYSDGVATGLVWILWQ